MLTLSQYFFIVFSDFLNSIAFLKGEKQMSLIFKAVKDNDLKALKQALKECRSNEDLSGALRNAAELGRLDLVKCFVAAGVCDDWAVVSAASFASLKVVRFLCHRCAGNLDAALIGAAAHGRSENVRFLLKAGAKSLNEALADAVLRGYDDTAKILLKHGADPFTAVYGGRTAAQMAAERADKTMLSLFEKRIKK